MIALVLDVLTTASILFVVASGLLLVFGVMKIINFAHGAVITLGGYAALACTGLGMNPWLGLPLGALVGGVAGVVVESLAVRPLYARPLDAILATWGLGIVISQVVTLCFGRGVHFARSPLTGTVNVLGTEYSLYRLSLVLVALALGGLLTLLLQGTRLGLETRSVIMNEDLARGLGINSGLVRFVTFSLGSALAGIAGMVIAPLSSIDPNMGVPWQVNAFMLVMVSGYSLLTLAVSCLVLGAAQVLISVYIDPILGELTYIITSKVMNTDHP